MLNWQKDCLGSKHVWYENKEWIGVLGGVTSAPDNEEDDMPGERSVTLKVGKYYYEFFDHEVKSIEAAE